MSEILKQRKPWVNWVLFASTVIVVFLIGLFTSSIMERRAEKVAKFQQVADIASNESKNEVWGQNYPREYETYLGTLDTNFKSKYGGSASTDLLKDAPEAVILWAGYPFSKDYNQARGHAHAIEDIHNTLRTGGEKESPLPATCWTCKSPDVPRMMAQMGPAAFYDGKWKDRIKDVRNSIGCLDCHDPKTMNLRISRPALIEGLKASGKDMSKITHNEMRSLVCAQCHVEYYFDKKTKYLIFPWQKGFNADSMEAYYDNVEFYDFIHKLSRTPILKAQHPDYELHTMGIHAKRGVSCADCHMPYKVEGGLKFSDHQVRSPLANIANSCQVCHKESEDALRNDVYDRQDRVIEIRRIAEKILAAAHLEAKIAWDNGATEEEMKPILKLIRHSQWRWDWVAASNGVGFHAPVEALRVLGTSIQKGEQARGLLAQVLVKHGVKIPVQLPDYSTKEKAQSVIGLDMKALKEDKLNLLNNVIRKLNQ